MEKLFKIEGRFFSINGQRAFVRCVTLGPFPPEKSLTEELTEIKKAGFNAVRVYEAPSKQFLDQAAELGIIVFASVVWDWGNDFIHNPKLLNEARFALGEFLDEFEGHPALAAIYIANEIPGELVRLMRPVPVREALEELLDWLKERYANCYYGYANYPTTEYLELSNTDFCAFNVYLEDREKLEQYLAHLNTLAGHRPFLISEVGFDKGTFGEERQATLISEVLEVTPRYAQGVTFFAWSDIWWSNGQQVEGWKFGLKDENDCETRALTQLSDTAVDLAVNTTELFSIIICTYNGAERIEECLEAVTRQNDPNYEVIVIDDGSRDGVAEVVKRFEKVRLIQQANQGLSAARNKGAECAEGSLLAYTDDDARPDADWLFWLRKGFEESVTGMVGGVAIAPHYEQEEQRRIANAPGQATAVLISDTEAEHLPGCNMAVRKSVWKEVKGFNPLFRIAGDDVDFCWRVIDAGHMVTYESNALVWHDVRPTKLAYLRQQWNYGKAEVLLYGIHPERFAGKGIHWKGMIYGDAVKSVQPGSIIYSGDAGSAPYQKIISQENRFSQSSLVKAQMVVRSLARFLGKAPHGLWSALTFFPNQKGKANEEGGVLYQFWNADYRAREDVLEGFLTHKWTLLNNSHWDLEWLNPMLKTYHANVSLGQTKDEGTLVYVKVSAPLKEWGFLSRRGWELVAEKSL